MPDIKDDPLRTAGPGELWSDLEPDEELPEYDPDSDEAFWEYVHGHTTGADHE